MFITFINTLSPSKVTFTGTGGLRLKYIWGATEWLGMAIVQPITVFRPSQQWLGRVGMGVSSPDTVTCKRSGSQTPPFQAWDSKVLWSSCTTGFSALHMSSSTQRHFAANSKYYLIILSLVTAHGSESLVQLVCVVCEDLQQLQAGFCILITGQINPQLCIGVGGWGGCHAGLTLSWLAASTLAWLAQVSVYHSLQA